MSQLGQQRKSRTTNLMSVIPPIAEVARRGWHFRYVPNAVIRRYFTRQGAPGPF